MAILLSYISVQLEIGNTLHSSLVDAFLHAAYDEFGSEFLSQFITILDGFLEVMSRVDVQQREWNLCRIESFVGKICYHDNTTWGVKRLLYRE